jgi:serine protease AprX
MARNEHWLVGRYRQVTTAMFAAVALALPVSGTALATGAAHHVGSATAVIVRANSGQLAQARHDVTEIGGRVGAPLSIINGFTAQIPAAALAALQHAPGIASVVLDGSAVVEGGTYSPYSDAGSPVSTSNAVGYNQYFASGYAGNGVGVALIDSGVSPVADLSTPGKVFYGPDFTPTGYFSQVRGLDEYGHGTFMAGLIAGRDPAATAPYDAESGLFLGAAPDAHIISVKVADQTGATVESAIIAGIQWVVAHRADPGLNIKVLNLSLGVRAVTAAQSQDLSIAVEQAWTAGITVVAAAGNDGLAGLVAPAIDPYVIAVGALDNKNTTTVADDQVASFSDLGAAGRNPDLVAPGTHIVSLRDPGSTIDQAFGTGAGSVATDQMRGSGTSEAAAITSGAVALLLSERPGITPDQIKATLKAHTMSLPNLTPLNAGSGSLDLAYTLGEPTTSSTQTWPPAGGSLSSPPPVPTGGASTTPSGSVWASDWSAVNWAGATWTGATWTGAHWTGAHWTGALWTGAHWTGATWTGAVWTAATWQTTGWS